MKGVGDTWCRGVGIGARTTSRLGQRDCPSVLSGLPTTVFVPEMARGRLLTGFHWPHVLARSSSSPPSLATWPVHLATWPVQGSNPDDPQRGSEDEDLRSSFCREHGAADQRLSLKPGVVQNIAFLASPTARNSCLTNLCLPGSLNFISPSPDFL